LVAKFAHACDAFELMASGKHFGKVASALD